jgi:hypothetical protein
MQIDLLSGPETEATWSVPLNCRAMQVTGRLHTYDPPDNYAPVDRQLSDGVALLGYDLAPASPHPGDVLEVTLYWRPEAVPEGTYTVFVHLYGPDGQLIAQHDGLPCAAGCPTPSWLPGEILTDPHHLTLPESSAQGTYVLSVGMYDSQTLARLPVPGTTNDQINLTTLNLGP